MNGPGRRVLWGTLALAAVAATAVVAYLLFSLDAIVERAIEREGTRLLGAAVRVGSVELDLRAGSGRIRGLRVAHPEGFDGDGDALRLDEIELALEPASLRRRPVRLSEVRVAETAVELVIDGSGRSNLDRIVRHARERPARDPDAAPGEPTRVTIDRVRFAGGRVRVDLPDGSEPRPLALPGFERTNLGGASGATGGEIARTLVQALARQVAAVAAGSEVERAVSRELGGAAGEAAGSIVRGLLD